MPECGVAVVTEEWARMSDKGKEDARHCGRRQVTDKRVSCEWKGGGREGEGVMQGEGGGEAEWPVKGTVYEAVPVGRRVRVVAECWDKANKDGDPSQGAAPSLQDGFSQGHDDRSPWSSQDNLATWQAAMRIEKKILKHKKSKWSGYKPFRNNMQISSRTKCAWKHFEIHIKYSIHILFKTAQVISSHTNTRARTNTDIKDKKKMSCEWTRGKVPLGK